MNFGQMAEVLGFDEDEFHEMLELFVETTEADLATLKSAVEQQDTKTTVEAAHSIKGAARSFGFDELSGWAASIEENARQNDLSGSVEAMAAIGDRLNKIIAELKNH